MALETATYINNLVAANPTSADPKSQGDDQIRVIKYTLTMSLPNIGGAVTATHTELNYVVGVTSPIQAQLNGKASAASPAFTGTPTAPTAPAGTSTDQLATTAFVTATAFQTALPGQTSNAGKFTKTDGTNAGWDYLISDPWVSYSINTALRAAAFMQ